MSEAIALSSLRVAPCVRVEGRYPLMRPGPTAELRSSTFVALVTGGELGSGLAAQVAVRAAASMRRRRECRLATLFA